MPYDGPNDPKLPSNVKEMDAKKRRQWVHVFESAVEDGDDEGKAFAKANGVASKAYIESYEIYGKQIEQGQAGYNAVGGNNEKACANCNWFVSPDGCILVGGTISPTGLSGFWRVKQEYTSEPIPVVVVSDDKSLISTNSDGGDIPIAAPPTPTVHENVVGHIINFARGLLGRKEQPVFTLFKDNQGNLRFFAMPTNMFEDRQGQIIESAAHKEFVDWVDNTKLYPELWIWHVPGSRIGRTDWIDFTENGMLCASGIIDKEFEDVAVSLASKDMAMSHGFFRFGELPHISKYRSFEISLLPRARAANFGTDFLLEQKEMAFSEEKRKLMLDNGVTEETIKQWETNEEKLGKQLKEMGVAWKENDDQVEQVAQVEQTTEIAQLTSAVSMLIDKINGMETGFAQRVEAVEKSFDEKVEETLTAKIAKMPQGFRPSESSENIEATGVVKKEHEDTLNWFYGEVVGKAGK